MKTMLMGLLVLAGCSTEELGLSPHLLTAQPGCWTPAAQAPDVPATRADATPQTGDAFAQLMAATRQMAEYQAAFGIQRFGAITDAIRADPGADAWSVAPGTASHGSGLVTGDDEAPPATDGTLTVPGRAPGIGFGIGTLAGTAQLLRVDATVLDRSAEHLDIAVEITESSCVDVAGCSTVTTSALLQVTPSLSTIELPDQLITWNDDYVSIRTRFSASSVPFHRGCDPMTGTSFERRIGMVSSPSFAITSELACWDAAGVAISCDAVDLTPES